MGKQWKQWQTLFLGPPKSLQMVTAAMKLKDAYSLKEKLWQTHIKKQRHYFANKGLSSQSYDFSNSHVWVDYKESWVPKNWCFWTVVLEKTLESAEHRRIDEFELWCCRRLLESPLDCKEIQSVHPKGNQSWIFIGRTDAETETPILLPPDAKKCLIGKDPDAGKDWRREEKRMTEDEMVGWHHWLNECEFKYTPGVGNGQWGLACCSPWGCKESHTTDRLNWTRTRASVLLK